MIMSNIDEQATDASGAEKILDPVTILHCLNEGMNLCKIVQGQGMDFFVVCNCKILLNPLRSMNYRI